MVHFVHYLQLINNINIGRHNESKKHVPPCVGYHILCKNAFLIPHSYCCRHDKDSRLEGRPKQNVVVGVEAVPLVVEFHNREEDLILVVDVAVVVIVVVEDIAEGSYSYSWAYSLACSSACCVVAEGASSLPWRKDHPSSPRKRRTSSSAQISWRSDWPIQTGHVR